MNHFFLALSFLTRIPVPTLNTLEPVDFGRAALYYPLVGLVVGVVLCIPLLFFPDASPILLAAMLTVLWAVVTGGLHLDGVADGADAWLGGQGNAEKTHRIMKDPLVGAAGAIAIASVMLLKFATLIVLLEQQMWWVILFAPILGRTAILLLFFTTPYVRRGGLGSSIADFLPKKTAWVMTAVCLGVGLAIAWSGVIAFLLGFWLLRRLMMRRLQGCTGDTAGATVELAEVFWMMGVGLSL